ncbi:hypothetical protein EX30DRAFT_359568 [Ascodesmis nigricans]|uniref:UDENN domain-containing protein n=1 Tax=Ascodesmis nigricans TaxID=341454 RepID=A0A4S2MS47_9PEZI|nr:hypothetical protein EX30DRAFT_359568 [Ascodesmis nigricans]
MSTLRTQSSFVRPRTSDNRPVTRDGDGSNALSIPSRTSSLHSRITAPIPGSLNIKVQPRTPKTLTHAYLVCGVGREPSQWVKAPTPAQGKISHMKGAINQFWLPEILGSSPRLEQDNDMARALHAAMRACFPHDVEICTGRTQPHCIHHTFVLQQDSSHTLYGIALRVWSRADDKRAETIRELRKRNEPDYYDSPDETYWIPYALSFLSRYPLFNLLGDYLRGMWIHWNKATNLFHAEEVSRILSFPAPRLNDLVRIDMKDYALCYQFPSSPTGFQNFAMWPLFCCLSIPNIVGLIEAALSPTRRIIFMSHYPAMLTVAAETIRFCVRVFEWSGLYVPIVHARHVREMVQEPGPYILGVTVECRSLFAAPSDALVVDLDRNFVLTSSPPTALSSSQRNKMIQRLTEALHGDIPISGVPTHLRSAYGGGKLVPAGQIIVMRGEVESVQDPEWWDQDAIMTVMDHVCEKMGRNTGIRAIFGGSVKKPLMTKVSLRHLNEIVRERNQYSRDAMEAWQDYINLKGRMDTEIQKVTKRNNFLMEEVESWKQQFEKFQSFAAQLTKEAQELKAKIESHKKENSRLSKLIEQQKAESNVLAVRLTGTEKQRDDALEALVMQQEVAEDLERERKKNKKELAELVRHNQQISRQRDEAQRVIIHLRALIQSQAHQVEGLVHSINDSNSEITPLASRRASRTSSRCSSRTASRASTIDHPTTTSEDSPTTTDPPTPSERSIYSPAKFRRFSGMSVSDIKDRDLKEKTDAIAEIIRSISDQCAAAVEGLHMSQVAALEEDAAAAANQSSSSDDEDDTPRTRNRESTHRRYESQDSSSSTLLSPDGRSSVPPTPELVHRASTALSMASTVTPERHSLSSGYGDVDVPTKIVEAEDGDEAQEEQARLGGLGKGVKLRGEVERVRMRARGLGLA